MQSPDAFRHIFLSEQSRSHHSHGKSVHDQIRNIDFNGPALILGSSWEKSLAKELGDICWYVAETAQVLGYDLETIMTMNIEKLKKRYPDGFSREDSINRTEDLL